MLSKKNSTWARPPTALAVAETVTVPLTVPPVGDVIAVVGAAKFATLKPTPLEVVTLLASSNALAVSVWAPLPTVVEFHVTLNGEVVDVPTRAPST